MLILLKAIAARWHSIIALSSILSGWYLRLSGRLLRLFPRTKMKERFINSILAARWPALEFPCRTAALGRQTQIALYPHVGEVDFDALFNRNMAYESEVFRFLEHRVSQYDAVVEIGANVGIFSIFFAKSFQHVGKPAAPVFAFEPSTEAFSRLLRNAAANSISNLHPFNCAVSDRVGLLDFFAPEGHLTNGSLSADFARIFSARVRRETVLSVTGEQIESLVRDYNRLLIKIDAEGSETVILKSLQNLVASQRPDIIIEVLEPFRDSLNALEFLDAYIRFNITSSGLVQHKQFAPTRFRDYILIPAPKETRSTALPIASTPSLFA